MRRVRAAAKLRIRNVGPDAFNSPAGEYYRI